MNNHLNDEQLNGYLHGTLTDSVREEMGSHLSTCPACRARLDDHQALQRRIHYGLLGDLRAARPSASMTFSSIAPRLKRPNRLGLWARSGQLVPAATALAALIGLMLALTGLAQGIGRPVLDHSPAAAAPLPTVSCLLFALPVIGNWRQSRTVPTRLILAGILTFILWIGTAVVALQVIIVLRDIAALLLLPVLGALRPAIGLANGVLIPLGIAWIALVFGGGEYHYKRLGQFKSWRLFGWTVAIETLFLASALFL